MLRLFMLASAIIGSVIYVSADLCLKYNRPAEYFDEALVIGNGNLGATVYGRVDTERISLNDITLWTGEPEPLELKEDPTPVIEAIRTALDADDYRCADSLSRTLQGHFSQAYQPLGNLIMQFHLNDTLSPQYERRLDLQRGAVEVKNGSRKVSYRASAPDSVLMVHVADSDGVDMTISLESQLPHSLSICDGEVSMSGYAAYRYVAEAPSVNEKFLYDPARGIHFRTIAKVLSPEDAVVTIEGCAVRITGCKEASIILTNVTSFNGYDKDPVVEGRDYTELARRRIDHAASLGVSRLEDRAVADYKRLFDAVSIDLGDTPNEVASLPTDEQLLRYTDEGEYNPELETMYFQYGRYLLISSSRTPGVPANLQGLWNEMLLPPWNCNYTVNINLQENYWMAETTGLSELHEVLLDFIGNLCRSGRVAAYNHWGVKHGWCLSHNSDIWAMTCPVGCKTFNTEWANWNMGGAWLATHIWEHYLYGCDKDRLRHDYPALKGAADFVINWLTEWHGHLITSPSTSPENRFALADGSTWAVSAGATADMAIARECLNAALMSARTLQLDSAFCDSIEAMLPRLFPYQIGQQGNLQEWLIDYIEPEPSHRHQSHLIGLYPGGHISLDSTPDLAAACARTLEIKGAETTGWSAGWRINLLARLADGQGAYSMYRRLLRYVSPDGYNGDDARRGGGTYPNLLDACPPFQIDGNLGGSAGVVEVLVQSTADTITLLPALPEQWSIKGHITGIRTRAGIVVDVEWFDGKVESLVLTSTCGGHALLRYNGIERNVSLKAGQTIRL